MKRLLSIFVIAFCACGSMHGQATGKRVDPLLKQHLQSPSVVADELRNFMLKRVPPLTLPADAKQWDKDAAKIRAHQLSVIYHGWPRQWVDSAPKFEKV
ncbi:MAG TPA: hypothetical protein VN670_06170, partial [Acidobacteriaceae bacterium]|nr:hypothetical protein [Acidobacteriaceae bacterium]